MSQSAELAKLILESGISEDEAIENLSHHLAVFTRLSKATPKELVDWALGHMPPVGPPYEQLIEELCTRVYPNWSNEDSPAVDGEGKS